ncbi:MAG: amidohydrolase family protein [Candidatus Anammoximicrobium sp.]|nr:amidohydrolase family protein [Candidatus Anammoximicrobium sp.]
MRVLGRRYDSREPVVVVIDDGRITNVSAGSQAPTSEPLPWLAPGFVDVQVNGFDRCAFNDPALTVEEVIRVSCIFDRYGVTSYCPTATTDSFEALSRTMATLARACDQSAEVASRIPGFHLEGPYITPEDGARGAHPRQHVRPPDTDEFLRLQDAAGGRIRILTLSPEYEGAPALIARAAAAGVVVAIGHTSATSDQIRAAVDAGARLSTHLGNGAHGQLRRHPNYIWDQLADDRLTASLIVDGHHLPAAVVKTFVRAKTAARCILISDVTSLGGLPPGRYDTPALGAVELLPSGRPVIAGQTQILAGAAVPITAGIPNLLRFTDEDLRSAVDMASTRPAALLGRQRPWLEVGQPADLVLFHLKGADQATAVGEVEVVATVNSGRLVFGQLPRA